MTKKVVGQYRGTFVTAYVDEAWFQEMTVPVKLIEPPPKFAIRKLTLDEGMRRHPYTDAMAPGSPARRLLDTKNERTAAILAALVEHCGGIEAARERVVVVPAQPWEPDAPWRFITAMSIEELNDAHSCTHVMLDGAIAWIGGFDHRFAWRERLAPGCPESVADALPDPR